jgi:hypothetical protein
MRTPVGLGPAGRALWRGITAAHELDPVQRELLLEACRAKDRLDKLDAVLGGDSQVWAALAADADLDSGVSGYDVRIGRVLTESVMTARTMAQLLAALRLPDPIAGRRPPRRPPRGVYGAGRLR